MKPYRTNKNKKEITEINGGHIKILCNGGNKGNKEYWKKTNNTNKKGENMIINFLKWMQNIWSKK